MTRTSSIVVGTGGMGRAHIRCMIGMKRTTSIVGLVEPDEASREAARAVFAEHRLAVPPFYASVRDLVKTQGSAEAAFICSPHKFHFENSMDCLLNGMDVCLEKPMVMNVSEAQRLIGLRDKTRRLVLVAFPGSLSPAVHKAKELIAERAIGNVTAIAAFAHQPWKKGTAGTWRQIPEISGGGFLFDTGSHMINTVVDILGEDVARVAAILDNSGTPVEINSTISAISRSGVVISLTGAGESIQSSSQVMVFGDKGIIKTGIWGECLSVKKADDRDFKPVPYPESRGPWEYFLKVRAGKARNPCPPEVGLRFAKLMDMIKKSAKTGRTASL